MAKVDQYRIRPGMNYVARRRRFLFKPAPTPDNMPVAEKPAPMPTAPALKHLIVYTSSHEQCGVREYARELDDQLRELGVNLLETPLNNLTMLREAAPGQVFLLHVEPSLLGPDFDNALSSALQRGAYVAVCFHYLDDTLYSRVKNRAHAMVRHRDYGLHDPRLHEVPLGCPVYEPPSGTERQVLRQRFGLPKSAIVVTTVGFLAPWKQIPETALQLLGRLPANAHLQLICPSHFSGESGAEAHKLSAIVDMHPTRTIWTSSFIPARELLDRVAASDLGFVYHPVNTGSCSAATKPFVSARCPVVVTSSNHASDIREGAIRTSELDIAGFAETVASVTRNPHSLQHFRAGMQRDYERLNMRRVAEQYLNVFRNIGVNLV